ncbi:CRP-like cAMP-binding protein [Pedobacter cryoconitis]|uniref:CRP-like cAMP-binding protein n=1 Tax=Pedobacter cryoconitis TaxID=188932 RepID=A0A7W8ZQP2_9SPHI|nr:Crp/Fnr family transcriptional regulator [Pedobacter cryoconitis]MBB5638278.1 CRP-like cAMP-binding protein [Pedobacter cryoconitis]
MQAQLISFLTSYHPITQSDAQLISLVAEKKNFSKGSTLSEAGKVCRELFFICSGILRIFRSNENGNEVTHVFLGENRFCTVLQSFNEKTISLEAIQACTDTEVLVVSYSDLHKLYTQIPYLEALIHQIHQQSLLDKIQLQNAYRGYDSSERYELFLKRQPEIALYVSQSDIASYLGITPQSLSRIRKNR